jgi:hypothetical protein
MIERLARADHCESTSVDRPEELQETVIPWSVYSDGPNDGAGQSLCECATREKLPLLLGLLIVVPGRQTVILVGWRLLDLTLNADGRAVHETTDTRAARGVEQILGRFHVDPREFAAIGVLGAISGCKVEHSVERLEGAADSGAIRDIYDSAIHAQLRESFDPTGWAHIGHDVVTGFAEPSAKSAAREACGARDQHSPHLHTSSHSRCHA